MNSDSYFDYYYENRARVAAEARVAILTQRLREYEELLRQHKEHKHKELDRIKDELRKMQQKLMVDDNDGAYGLAAKLLDSL